MDEKIDDEKFRDWVLRRLFVINEELGAVKEDVNLLKKLVVGIFIELFFILLKAFI